MPHASATVQPDAVGLRACEQAAEQAIKPLHRELVAQACRLMETTEPAPPLDQLAAQAGLSRFHFHRVFKAQTGLTPKGYAAAFRARTLREQLQVGSGTITEAIYDAGFQSNSRFYAAAPQILGMRAKDYRAGGKGQRIHFAVGQCALGALLVAQSSIGICAIALGDDPEQLVRDLQDRFAQADVVGAEAGFEQLMATVVGLVEQPGLGLQLPLDICGTAFQQRVWQALQRIAPGTTLSYGELAERIGAPRAVRAVASACAANPLAVAIPCHRVVRRDGEMAGYRWGIERKRALLLREAQAAK